MARVEMYVKTFCPYCYRAEMLLESKGVEFETHLLDSSERRQEMIERANGRTTVPQIFIDDHHVGGCDDLYALDRDGKLEQLLKAA